MFGFQPIPTAGSPWRFSNWIFPPPPPPPCHNNVDCNNYSLEWASIPTIDIIKGPSAGYAGVNLSKYLYTSVANNTYPGFCIVYSLEDSLPVLPPGLRLDPEGFIWGEVGCGTPGIYTVTVGARPSVCTVFPTTTVITFDYYCNSAQWATDPITINGAAGGQITYNLANYTKDGSLSCGQNYYYDGDSGGNSASTGPNVSVTFGSAGTYYGSATVDNTCQSGSYVTLGIIYNIT